MDISDVAIGWWIYVWWIVFGGLLLLVFLLVGVDLSWINSSWVELFVGGFAGVYVFLMDVSLVDL